MKFAETVNAQWVKKKEFFRRTTYVITSLRWLASEEVDVIIFLGKLTVKRLNFL